MRLYTIGFTKKSAERFFGLLTEHGIECLIDIRLKPGGQLAGFAKRDDLAFFLRQLAGCEYRHLDRLAPTAEILSDYRKDQNWERYVERFEALMRERNMPDTLDPADFREKVSCLLCSEATPDQCHRRLVAERLERVWPEIETIHLV